MGTTEIGTLISQFGLPIALLVVVILGIWKITRMLGTTLLNKQDGLVTKMVDKHLAFLTDASATMQQTSKTQQEIVLQLGKISEDIGHLKERAGVDTSGLGNLVEDNKRILLHLASIMKNGFNSIGALDASKEASSVESELLGREDSEAFVINRKKGK